jgi:hypothetical protein
MIDHRVLERSLAGEVLYGDDFSPTEIAAWFEDERNGYFALEDRNRARYQYGYHALNQRHAYRFLPTRPFKHTLGFGSAYCDELLPILDRLQRITVVEPGNGFESREIRGKRVEYHEPEASGKLKFADESFDLITCFSVLHHIPNVSEVVRELARCLEPGGFLIFREPVISMGDWRRPRKGLTQRERGIPFDILRRIIEISGLEILQERRCMFPVTARLRYLMPSPVYNSQLCVRLDEWVSRLPFWPNRYHPAHWYHKLRPSAVSVVAQKLSRCCTGNRNIEHVLPTRFHSLRPQGEGADESLS